MGTEQAIAGAVVTVGAGAVARYIHHLRRQRADLVTRVAELEEEMDRAQADIRRLLWKRRMDRRRRRNRES